MTFDQFDTITDNSFGYYPAQRSLSRILPESNGKFIRANLVNKYFDPRIEFLWVELASFSKALLASVKVS